MTYEGFLHGYDETDAHFTVTDLNGRPPFDGWFPAEMLQDCGVKEQRRFKLTIEPIPDAEVSEDRERQIHEDIDEALGD